MSKIEEYKKACKLLDELDIVAIKAESAYNEQDMKVDELWNVLDDSEKETLINELEELI